MIFTSVLQLFLIIFYFNFNLSFIEIKCEPIVSLTISNGVINGKTETSVEGKPVNVFRGIPYAEPPIGKLRFKKPLPVTKRWEQPIDAFEYSNACIQRRETLELIHGIKNFSEDCLYLNVVTPVDGKEDNSALKPVMVWIHWGGFEIGSAGEPHYNLNELASRGQVVMVSFNYRLGALGFLYTGTDEAPGNVGLWDQVLALEWINDNIRYFGGDPKQITLFGVSAGGWSSSLHMLSPASKYLFKNVIVQSGAYIDHFFLPDKIDHVDIWLKGAELLGCYDNSMQGVFSQTIINCLIEMDPDQLIKLTYLPGLRPSPLIIFPFVVVDGDFLPDKPMKMIEKGDFKQEYNLLISTTSDEGNFLLPQFWNRDNYDFYNPKNFTFNEAFNELKEIASNLSRKQVINVQKMANFYFTGLSDTNDFDDLRLTIGNPIGDFMLLCPTLEFAKQVFKSSGYKVNVYQYLYNSKSQEFIECGPWMGVCHANDLIPMFGNSFLDKNKYSERDREISAQMMDILTTFAKTGAPPAQEGVIWPKYYNINDNIIAPYYDIKYKSDPVTNFKIGYKLIECEYIWKKYM